MCDQLEDVEAPQEAQVISSKTRQVSLLLKFPSIKSWPDTELNSSCSLDATGLNPVICEGMSLVNDNPGSCRAGLEEFRSISNRSGVCSRLEHEFVGKPGRSQQLFTSPVLIPFPVSALPPINRTTHHPSGKYRRTISGIFFWFSSRIAMAKGSVSFDTSTIGGAFMLFVVSLPLLISRKFLRLPELQRSGPQHSCTLIFCHVRSCASLVVGYFLVGIACRLLTGLVRVA